MTGKTKSKLILASTSPRRRLLMKKAGYKFEVIAPKVDESTYTAKKNSPVEFAKALALAKAKSVSPDFPDSIVIGADTIVDFEGEIIGKPDNADHAREITQKLFSRPHKVITALALVKQAEGIELVKADTTRVYPKKMTAEQIARHIEGKSWQGKAGAYAIQETGDKFVEKIDGSLTNVMGLPMELLGQLLKDIDK